MPPHEPDNRIALRPRGNAVLELLSELSRLAVGCVIGLIRIGFSVRVTIRLGGVRFKMPQAFFATITAVLAYLFLACIVACGKRVYVTDAHVSALDCGNACCRIVTACDLHSRLEPLTSRSRMWPADHTPVSSLYSALQVSPLTPRADLRGAAREAAHKVRDAGFSDAEVDSIVPAIYRTAQFLVHNPSRHAYDEFFMPKLQDSHFPPGPAANGHQPHDTSAALRRLAPMCSAASGQCCETAVGSP